VGEFAPVKERLEPALQLSGQPVKRGTMAHEHIVYMMLVDSAASMEDADSVNKYVPRLIELAIRDNHKPYLAIGYRASGIAFRIAGDHHQADEHFQEALKIFTDLEMPWQAGRTLSEMGKLARLQGDVELSKKMFTKALQAFEKIQAKSDSMKLQKALEIK